MMDNILVSILVPVYNTSEYLRKCLDTLTNQTLKEIEIICVNDGSTDNSLEILEEYRAKDPRVIIVNKKNGGLPSARNAGIDNARGEYLGFVDSDDYVEPTMFELLYKAAKKRNSEVVVCGAEIFPESPAPSAWLREVLSPRDCHYPKFTTDVLFKEKSRPFLWRNLVKRELIERENIRLKEDIVLGEDQAFQFKVYPKAKGITFISDKLYHYCWYRPGSIMNTELNRKIVRKVDAHVNLCTHVMDEIKRNPTDSDMRKEILLWAVELLFDDFIKLSYKDRFRIAKKLVDSWRVFGYWNFHNSFAPHINDMFRYFHFIANSPEPATVDVSLIVNLYNSKDYFSEFKKSIIDQKEKNIEIIFINNAADNGTYIHLHKWLTSDCRVRVVNQAYSSLADTFNQALYLAEGDAVVFCDAHDVLSSQSALSSHYQALVKDGADVSCATTAFASGGSLNELKLYSFMFKKQFLIDNEIKFENYSSLTTRIFTAQAVYKAGKVATSEEDAELFRLRSVWRRDWVYTDDANAILEGYVKLLNITSEAKDSTGHIAVIDELNSDKTAQLVLNATNPYLMPSEMYPNGENSQSKTFELICQINSAVDRTLAGSAAGVFRLLGEFVNRRHAFLSNNMHL